MKGNGRPLVRALLLVSVAAVAVTGSVALASNTVPETHAGVMGPIPVTVSETATAQSPTAAAQQGGRGISSPPSSKPRPTVQPPSSGAAAPPTATAPVPTTGGESPVPTTTSESLASTASSAPTTTDATVTGSGSPDG